MAHNRTESTISTVSITQQEPELYRTIQHTLQDQKNVVNEQLNELLKNLILNKIYNSKILEQCQIFIRDFLSIPSQAFNFSSLQECLKQIQSIFNQLQNIQKPQEFEVEVVEMIVQSITNLASLISGCILQCNNTATVSQVENEALELQSDIDGVPTCPDSLILYNYILNSFNKQFIDDFIKLNPEYKQNYIECRKKQKFTLFNKQNNDISLYQQLKEKINTERQEKEFVGIINNIEYKHDIILKHIHKRIHQIQQDYDSLDQIIRSEYNLQPPRFPSNVSPIERTLQYFLDVLDLYKLLKQNNNGTQLAQSIMNRLSCNLSYNEDKSSEQYNIDYKDDISFEEDIPYIVQTQQNDEMFSEALNDYYNKDRVYDRPLFISALADQQSDYQPQQSMYTLVCEGQLLVGLSYLIEQIKSEDIGLGDAEQIIDVVKILSMIFNNTTLCSYGEKGIMNKIKQLQHKQIYYKNIKQLSNSIYKKLLIDLNNNKLLIDKRGFISLNQLCLYQVLNIHYYKNMMIEIHGKHYRIQSLAQSTALQYIEKQNDSVITSDYCSQIPTHELDNQPFDIDYMVNPLFVNQQMKPMFRLYLNQETIDILSHIISMCIQKLYLITYFDEYDNIPQKFKEQGELLGIITKNFKSFGLSKFIQTDKDLQTCDSGTFVKLLSDLQQKIIKYQNQQKQQEQQEQNSFNSEWSFNQNSNQSNSNEQLSQQNEKQEKIEQPEQNIKHQMKLSDFIPLQKIASGGYGTVILARNTALNRNLAIKIIKKEDIMRKNAVNRIRIEQQIYKLLERKRQRNINIPKANYHDFIVRFYGSFKTSAHLFLILEYMPQGDLANMLQKCGSFDEQWAQQLIAEIILALTYLHACSICYNDLKPENILLDQQGHIKFTDFGISTVTLQKQFQKQTREDDFIEHIGMKSQTYTDLAQLRLLTEEQDQLQKDIKHLTCTPYYAAPELINGETPSFASDWWAVGVILYQFIFGVLPFDGDTVEQVFSKILNTEPDFYEDEQVCSQECIDFIKQLICKNKNQRIQSFKEISTHQWLRNFSWDNLFQRKAVVVPKEKKHTYLPMFDDNTNWIKQLLQNEESVTTTTQNQNNQVSSYTDQFENFSFVNSKLLSEIKNFKESMNNKNSQ